MHAEIRISCLSILLILGFSLLSCHSSGPPPYALSERTNIDSIIRSNPTIDSLTVWLKRYTETENNTGIMLVHKELGKRYREATLFNEAIRHHQQSIQLATQLADTLEMIQALNNIGTNFRRMGVLDEASTYHYRALLLCEQYNDRKTYTAQKNRAVSLNGIGNIYLTLENHQAADSIFRLSLEVERQLKSHLGQAINYANLGAIFEARGMTDSAWVYYRQSMEQNREAKSNLGIALCYNHFGRLYEKQKNWEAALVEYKNAYQLMSGESDSWHWLEACLALARVNIAEGNIATAKSYLEQAEETAQRIRSWEHLIEVYRLNYLRYEKLGDNRRALDSYINSQVYADSMRSTEKLNHTQNLHINYEREKNLRELAFIQQSHQTEQRTKNIFLIAALLILALTISTVGFLWYVIRTKSRNQRMMRRMEKVRNNFFTNVTHEFRTPLTVILGMAEQLQNNNKANPELETGLTLIARQGRNLLDLVNQLLEVSKVKSEVGEPEWRTGDIVAYTHMIVENHRAYAQSQQVNLCFKPVGTTIIVDFVPEYFRKIIRNLLSNAIKFTPAGGYVTLVVEMQKNNLKVCVADTGSGIDTEDLPHIFDIFYQGSNSKIEMGTGIGLSLVKQMVESMNGQISVQSTPNVGTEFTLTLPLHHGNSLWEKWTPDTSLPTEAFIPENTDDTNTSQPTILIIEDNADISYYIGGLLKTNYRLLYARNGVEGLEKANEHVPDLIISDLMMPEMDGYELCRHVRQSPILDHIPIIVITAKCNENDRIQALDLGADAYLTKPFNTDELHTRIARLLEQRRLLREKYSQAMREGTQQELNLSPREIEFLKRLTDIIYTHIADANLNSLTVADLICMSKSQLNRKIRAITGYSTAAYILQIRMEKAKLLLNKEDIPIAEIAMQCGFEDAGYFGRVFKQAFEITPSQFRRK